MPNGACFGHPRPPSGWTFVSESRSFRHIAEKKNVSKARLGYVVWGTATAIIVIPELAASNIFGGGDVFPFTTISHMTGHLERHHPWVELVVVAIIVLAVFSAVRVPPKPIPAAAPEDPNQPAGAKSTADPNQPGRTAGGRLTFDTTTRPTEAEAAKFDAEPALGLYWFILAAVVTAGVVAVATWIAAESWADDGNVRYHPAYVLYGLLGLLWVIIPSAFAIMAGERKEFFPTLFRTVNNFEELLRRQTWRWRLGPTLGWLTAYIVVTGLAILLLHLTLYPYPDITHIINPKG